MKKFFSILALFSVIFMFVSDSYSQSLSDALDTGKEKVHEILDTNKGNRCPIYKDTPLSNVDRPMFEMGPRWNVGDFPSGGSPQFRFENVDITFIGNLGPTFHWYTWIGSRATEKKKYTYENESEEYDNVWHSKMAFVGVGLYLHPIIRVFGGFGKIELSNDGKSAPGLSIADEFGIALSYPFYNNRIELMYKSVDASVEGDDIPVQDAPADGSYNSFSVSFIFPIDF